LELIILINYRPAENLIENSEKKLTLNHKDTFKPNIRGMIKDLFSNDFLNDDTNNFSKTKYDKGITIINMLFFYIDPFLRTKTGFGSTFTKFYDKK